MMRGHGLVAVLALLVVGSLPAEVLAYGGSPHQNICVQALEVYYDQVGEFPELADYFEAEVKYGAKDEDYTDYVYGQTGDMTTVTHFWDADDGDDDHETVLHIIIPITAPNAWTKNKVYLNWAASEYLMNNNKSLAYRYLGHMCHLLSDMGVPSHVHEDAHAIDDCCYEDWMSDGGYTHWGAGDALTAGGLVPVPESALTDISGGVGLYWPEDPMAYLYYLMYTTNQTADYFASDGFMVTVPVPPLAVLDPSNGDTYDKWGWMGGYPVPPWPSSPTSSSQLDWCSSYLPFDETGENDASYEVILVVFVPTLTWEDEDSDFDGDLSRIGSHAYVYAIRAVATLYKVWHDYFDPLAPSTAISLSGLVGDNGWYRSPVEVTLTAEDNGPQHNADGSGVHRTEYRVAAGAPQVYATPFTISDEGLTDVHYHSMDMFGNWEGEQTEQVKVDTVPPDVTITSPVDGASYPFGFPLSFEFSATDMTSGVASVTGLIDGVLPVGPGEVVDDLGLGSHTLVVTGRDNAGNTSSPSVTFEVINTPGKVTAWGAIKVSDAHCRFTVRARYDQGEAAPTGFVIYKDPQEPILVTSMTITALGIWDGNKAAIAGECMVNYKWQDLQTFRIDLVDNGPWGDGDEFHIDVGNGYLAGAVLWVGDVKVMPW